MLLNLYGIRGGKEAVFKKDHIVLKRKSDPSSLENHQMVCEHCNSENRIRAASIVAMK
jgi:hypothetical protein